MTTPLIKWFERKYLEYQMENGLKSLKEFSDIIGISRPYLSLILSGERSEISEHLAMSIAKTLRDYTLLDILGYDRPPETKIPPSLKSAFDSAVDEISRKYNELGITDFSSDEAVEIAKDTFVSHGFTFTENAG